MLLADGADKCVVDLKLKTKAGVDFGGQVKISDIRSGISEIWSGIVRAWWTPDTTTASDC